ncbi:hypothetical protein A4X13_0g4003 [Tilletia indica]|uniref:Uncharacterized protein n=1 Tax=Tilletia indica TaxID=43049 RepID=A0A177TD41_9BASI|nr:hypothetical protein A4X13_0g4003 [Tilletia indica]
MEAAATVKSRKTFAALPIEILTLIARALLPSLPATTTTFPPPENYAEDRNHYSTAYSTPSRLFPSTAYLRNLLALALVSRTCAAAALPVLYSVLQLRAVSQLHSLVNTLRPSSSSTSGQLTPLALQHTLAHRVTDIGLPFYIGIHELRSEDLSDDDGYGKATAIQRDEDLRALFDACSRLEHISLTTFQISSVFQNLFHPNTLARPRELTLQIAMSRHLDLTGCDLRPLSRVTRLHLIGFQPSRVMLDFLHGFSGRPASTADEDREGGDKAKEDEEQQLGTHPLTHLRLSIVNSHAFDGLAEYIQARELAMGRNPEGQDDHDDPQRRRARTSDEFRMSGRDPRFLIAGSRQLTTQQALYNLAADADLFPDLRLVQIELDHLRPLEHPSAPMERESPTVTLSPRADSPAPLPPQGAAAAAAAGNGALFVSTGGHGAPFDQYSAAMPGQLATVDFPADVPLSAIEAAEWEAQEREALAAEERQRTAHRDAYWLNVRQGREALLTLFQQARASRSGDDRFELKIVAPRPNGWSAPEMEAQFALGAFSTARRRARGSRVEQVSLNGVAGGEEEEEVEGCWADEDVFELAERRPWLAFASGGLQRCSQWKDGQHAVEEGEGDESVRERTGARAGGRGRKMGWWTGELPRLNAGGGGEGEPRRAPAG